MDKEMSTVGQGGARGKAGGPAETIPARRIDRRPQPRARTRGAQPQDGEQRVGVRAPRRPHARQVLRFYQLHLLASHGGLASRGGR